MIKLTILLVSLGIALAQVAGEATVEANAGVNVQNVATNAPVTYRYFIFTEQCYQSIFVQGNFLNFQCLKKALVKYLGYSVVIGAAIVKVPQIVKIIKNKSTVGISFGSIQFEIFMNIFAVAYHINKANPFSVFGQTLLIAIQMMIIHLLFIIYSTGSKTTYLLALLPVSVMFWAAFNPAYFPQYILTNTIVVQMIMNAGARILQIVEIHRLKSTGSLAFITCFLMFLGNISRMGTAFVEVAHDWLFGLSTVQAFLFNAYIVSCFFIFGAKKEEKIKDKKN